MDEALTLPAVELAARIRDGDLSPVDLVEAHIARLEAVQPIINALVADRYEAARAEAGRATEAIAAGGAELPPLHGVPFTAKEMVSVRGMPHTFGTLER
ncbi:MAG: amidase family protein, partial [Gemmatimonadota bacterium]